MSRKSFATLATAVVSLAIVLPLASAGTRTKASEGAGGCTVSGNVVNATGLPTNTVLNLFVTSEGSKDGWALGLTWDGAWSVEVPARTAPTTYEFASTTFGKNGSKYWVYASCSAS
jgi:hypothetical protein